MAYTFRIDPVLRCVFIKWIGRFTFDEFKIYFQQLENHPDFRANLNRIYDYREADIDLPAHAVRELADFDKSIYDVQGDRSAVLLIGPSELAFGIVRMYIALAEDSRSENRVARTFEQARTMLGLPADTPDPFPTMAEP